MLDFAKIAEMTFLVMEMEQVLVFDGGIFVDKDNFAEFVSFHFDT